MRRRVSSTTWCSKWPCLLWMAKSPDQRGTIVRICMRACIPAEASFWRFCRLVENAMWSISCPEASITQQSGVDGCLEDKARYSRRKQILRGGRVSA